MQQKILFLRVAWMNLYSGTRNDTPIGAGWWVKENKDGGEVANFYNINDRLYGYAEIQNNRSLRIERLGADKKDAELSDVTVVFFARNPITGGQFIVGWYQHATLFRSRQLLDSRQRLGHPYFFCSTAQTNARLVPTGERVFRVPDDGPGQTNAWYVMEYHDSDYLASVREYMKSGQLQKRKTNGKWRADFEARRRVEYAAMEAVAEYFETRGYEVSYVHTQNLGWDMEATANNHTLKLEVKGLGHDFVSVDLTPNEYSKSKSDYGSYRICIVANATTPATMKVEIFAFNKELDCWVNEVGFRLKKKEIVAARFFG